jgi:hypothetical protein
MILINVSLWNWQPIGNALLDRHAVHGLKRMRL